MSFIKVMKISGFLILLLVVLFTVYFLWKGDPKTIQSSTGEPILQNPVEGTWKVLNSPGHDEFAFDLVAVHESSRRNLSKSRFLHILGKTYADDFRSWNKPVYAPADGIVVQSADHVSDRRKLSLIKDLWHMLTSQPELNFDDITPFSGNYVVIRSKDFYSFLAHLKQNSLQVANGDSVEAGQFIGRVGNSGFTLEPHLHFQLFDQKNDLSTATAPAFFLEKYHQWQDENWKQVSHAPLKKGGLVCFGTQC